MTPPPKANFRHSHVLSQSLVGQVFTKADLTSAKFDNCDLRSTSFENARATLTTFDNCDLRNVNLKNAHAAGARFIDCDLQESNLEGVSGLSLVSFPRSDLRGAALDTSITEAVEFERISVLCRNAGRIFISVMLVCAYLIVTMYTIKDSALVLESADHTLPLVGIKAQISTFDVVGSIGLLLLFVYAHLYLQRMWRLLSRMPALFPDGSRLDQKIHPWPMTSLVRRSFKKLRSERSAYHVLEEAAVIFFAWYFVPLTLLVTLMPVLRGQSLGLILFHESILVLSAIHLLGSYWTHRATLGGSPSRLPDVVREQFIEGRRRVSILTSVMVVAVIVGLVYVTYYHQIIEPIPLLSPSLRLEKGLQLQSEFLSRRPLDFWRIPDSAKDSSIVGADLESRSLRWANLSGAYLVKGRLRGARLTHANLNHVNMRLSDCRKGALRFAHFSEADLRCARMDSTDCSHTHFVHADIRHAVLRDANLDSTVLIRAKLDSAIFDRVCLIRAKVDTAKGASFNGARLIQASLAGSCLDSCDFTGADLRSADLRGASLEGTDLSNSRLFGAVLAGVNLQSTHGLTQEQLDSARCGPTTTPPAGFSCSLCIANEEASVQPGDYYMALVDLNQRVNDYFEARDSLRAVADDSVLYWRLFLWD